jgi:hypothetical protein
LAPLFAVSPRLLFAGGVAAALVLTGVGARLLQRWGRSPTWALLLLAHPTVVIMARTVMVDLLLAAFAVGAWYELERGRRRTAAVLLGFVVLAKPTGVLVAAALVAGEALRLLPTTPPSRLAARLFWPGVGIAAGAALTALLNFVAAGTLWYGYAQQDFGTPMFSPAHLIKSLPLHLLGLLVCPPLLILSFVSLRRRRAFAPLVASVGLIAAMGSYFFVDHGRNVVETLVLAPRLILPALAMLMIGYADLLAGLVERVGTRRRWVSVLVTVVPALVCLGLATRHRAWQTPQAEALAVARQEVARLGESQLGLSGGAFKVGMLFPGATVDADGATAPSVVLCGEESSSRRAPGTSFRCERRGYDDRRLAAGFHVLTRQGAPSLSGPRSEIHP